MRIGIDIDGCIMDSDEYLFTYLPIFCKENNIKFQKLNNSYHTKEAFGLTDEQDIKFWTHYGPKFYLNEPPRKFAKETLEQLLLDGHETYIITARTGDGHFGKEFERFNGINYEDFTYNYFKRFNLKYTEMFFGCQNKVAITNKLKLDKVLDDSPENCMALLNETDTDICLFNSFCNLDIKNSNRITRVHSFTDFHYNLNSAHIL